MTRDEIDSALKRILRESADVAQNPLAREANVVAACVSMITCIIAEHEQRIRILEPCPTPNPIQMNTEHWFLMDGKCKNCGIGKVSR